uniref:C2 domain-containing protein n=1 Tax=Hyaloperonospora arabidopsidis (strain Emoy2) TaxID=559515 RepID=M4C2U6_HYAAE
MELPSSSSSTSQSLALVKKTALMPSLTSMTKTFFTKTFMTPPMKLWGGQSSPTGVDDLPGTTNSDGRGDICEIVVVAIQKVTIPDPDTSTNNEHHLPITFGSSRLQKSLVWGSTTKKLPKPQLSKQVPPRLVCTVRSGGTTKVSAQAERHDRTFDFDEKFVFERREHDAQYHKVTIDVSRGPSGFTKKPNCLGHVHVDLNEAFHAQATGPIYRHCALTTSNGSEDMGVEIHFVLHRLLVQNATAAAASRVLTRSSGSLNDDDDMDACGQIFPDLWYLC